MRRLTALVTACLVIWLISIGAQEQVDHENYGRLRQIKAV